MNLGDEPWGAAGIGPADHVSDMAQFRLRVAARDRHGMVARPLRTVPIEAATVRQASAIALGRADELFSDEANLAWLVDEAGDLVWTLRIEEAEPVPDARP